VVIRVRKKTWIATGAAAILFVATAGWFFHIRARYPFGWSHCCDKQLSFALTHYADDHDGWYPRGEDCPEASLSLLHRTDPDDVTPNLLRGKSVPLDAVRERLSGGLLLTAETCGWHYVDGLRKDDNPRLALFWDKEGLGHNGEWTGGAHTVWFVDGSSDTVSADRWDAFLDEQKALRTTVKR
jgi:hypothetical protein